MHSSKWQSKADLSYENKKNKEDLREKKLQERRLQTSAALYSESF